MIFFSSQLIIILFLCVSFFDGSTVLIQNEVKGFALSILSTSIYTGDSLSPVDTSTLAQSEAHAIWAVNRAMIIMIAFIVPPIEFLLVGLYNKGNLI
jgi:hypothetical protein